MESGPYNIVIIPPADISQKAIRISRELKKEGGLFALNGKTNFPHSTILIQELPLKNLSKIRDALRDVSKKTKRISMKSLGVWTGGYGYVGVGYERSRELLLLQKRIIKAVNPLRENLQRKSTSKPTCTYTKHEVRNRLRYGHWFVGTSYSPHMTLTKFAESKDSEALLTLPEHFSFIADRIGLFTLGDYGTSSKLVESYKLEDPSI